MKKLTVITIIALLLCSSMFVGGAGVAYAAGKDIEYTNVLEDLENDSSFDISNYPSYDPATVKEAETELLGKFKTTDLKLITIAEGYNKELYLYVYKPCNSYVPLKATSVLISSGYSHNGADLKPIEYELECVSSEGLFDKYLVLGYDVSSEMERYYNIVSIFREFNAAIDKSIDGGTTDDVACPVGQQWCCYYLNGELIYEMGTFSVAELAIKANGFLHFKDGFIIGDLAGLHTAGRLHYIAFDCENYMIQHIFDATMTYNIRQVTEIYIGNLFGDGEKTYEYSDWQKKEVSLYDTDTVKYKGLGLFTKEYKWNRITSSEEFIRNMESQDINFDPNSKGQLQNSQWVFAFAETEYDSWSTGQYPLNNKKEVYSEIAEVTVLRIHFLDINGKIYDLGVVADKTTADKIADGVGQGLDVDKIVDVLQKMLMVIAVIALVAVIVVLAQPLGAVFRVLWDIIKMVLKGLWAIVSFPFKLVGKLFQSGDGGTGYKKKKY